MVSMNIHSSAVAWWIFLKGGADEKWRPLVHDILAAAMMLALPILLVSSSTPRRQAKKLLQDMNLI